jgi:hypothetical protein
MRMSNTRINLSCPLPTALSAAERSKVEGFESKYFYIYLAPAYCIAKL